MTKAYEEHLLRACINSALSDVAQKEGVSVETLQGLLDRQIATTPDWKHVPSLEVIGIDEIALKKGHRDVVAIVTGQSGAQTHILGVLKDRKKATVVEFLSSIPKRLRRTVRVLCSDLHDGFIGAAKAVFGRHVRVVADRFHVAKLYREALDTLRKKELKRLKRTLSAQQYQRLNGAMWALRKQPEHLSDEEQAVLTRLFHWSPDLKDAVAFRDELTALFKA
jgi:transposase